MRRALLSLGLITILASCGGGLKDYKDKDIPDKPDTPDVPDTGGGGVNPNGCGNYATTNIGKKIKAFLEASVALDKAVSDLENHVKLACEAMGKELKMGDLSGDTEKVCKAVAAKLDATLKAAVKAEAKLDIEYKPAVCTVDASVEARAEAECAGSGSTGTGGSQAEGACAGSAKVEAAIEAKCEPAELTVNAGADIAVDEAKLEMAVKAIEVGFPKLLDVYGRLKVLGVAADGFVTASADLVKAGKSILDDVGDQILCVSGQIVAAADLVAHAAASVNVSISVSVEVSASGGASI